MSEFGNFISYISICVSFILIFNILMKYFDYFNDYICSGIKKSGIVLFNIDKRINTFCQTRMERTEKRTLQEAFFLFKLKSKSSFENSIAVLNKQFAAGKNKTHKLVVFLTILIAILTTQIPFYKTDLDIILDSYNIQPHNDYTGIWIITILASLYLHVVVYYKHITKLKKEGLGLSFIRQTIYISLYSIIFFFFLYFFHFLQQLFFLNIFIFYYVSILSVLLLIPFIEIILIQLPLMLIYSIILILKRVYIYLADEFKKLYKYLLKKIKKTYVDLINYFK